MALIGTGEAARRLGVTPARVRQLVLAGALHAEQPGRDLLVDEDAVARRAARPPGPGRPLAPRTAWQVLSLAADPASVRVGASPARVLRLLQASPDPERWPAWLAGRGRPSRWAVHPGLLAHLAADPGVVLSGDRVLADLGVDITVAAGLLGYVHEADLGAVQARYRLRPAEDGAVVLRALPPGVEPGPPALVAGPRRVAGVVAAIDLLEDGSARARYLAGRLVAEARSRVVDALGDCRQRGGPR